MREFDKEEQVKLELAAELYFAKLRRDIEQIKLDDETPDFDREKLRQAEAEAWQELYRHQRQAKTRRWAMLAACLLLALAAVMLAGKPSVAYQKFWNNLFVKDNGTSMSVSSTSTALLPDILINYYPPTEIPPEYAIESSEKNKFLQSILYINEAGNYIDFSVYIDDFNVNIDKEDCIFEEITISEKKGFVRTKYNNDEVVYISVSWLDNEMFFDLSANNLSQETLLNIAESVMIAE